MPTEPPVNQRPRVTVRMPEAELRDLRILAAQRQESAQEIILRAIRQYVSELGTEEVECSG